MKYLLCILTALQFAGTVAAQQAVDLGLSVLWADCNVGATEPEEVGIYVAWGELEQKGEYLMTNYRFCLGDFSAPTKYFAYDPNRVSTKPDGKTILEPEDDIATVMLGSDWRIPTNAEITELVQQCTWEWIADDEAPGYRVTGPSGNTIFLPAAGIKTGLKLMYNGHEGYYWTAESMYVADEVYCLRFTPRLVAHSNFKSTERWHGCVVRAVTAANIDLIAGEDTQR
jgi:hypothetical protein